MSRATTGGMTNTRNVGTIDHGSRDHAKLSPSSCNRWMHCTPSAMLQEKYGNDAPTSYSLEGTLAHEISELTLRKDVLNLMSEAMYNKDLDNLKKNEYYTPDMMDHVKTYVDYCNGRYQEAFRKNPKSTQFFVEQKLDMSEYVPNSFGTADCVIISDGHMEVIDLKYGLGVEVSAEHNEQLMMYGLGAYLKFKDLFPETITLTIVQPRKDNISNYTLSIYDLLHWANDELKPSAQKAYKGVGETKYGDWCRFCSVKAQCRTYNEESLKVADRYQNAEPYILTDDEISDILVNVPIIKEWAETVEEYAKNEAIINGKHWPGFKLVRGRSTRKWTSEEEAHEKILESFPTLTHEQISETKLLGITKIEKLVGKAGFKRLDSCVTKSEGLPTLVPEDDKREAIDANEEAAADFNEN